MRILTVDDLPLLIEEYRAKSGVAVSTLSKRLFNDPASIKNILAGRRDVASRRLKRLVQWFSDHWPEDAVWPEAIPRPAPGEPGTLAPSLAPGIDDYLTSSRPAVLAALEDVLQT